MAYTHKFDVNDTWAFLCPVALKCGEVNTKLERLVLLDTGAGFCHISFPLWCFIGLNKVCFNEKKESLNLMGVHSPDDMTFDKLPFPPAANKTELGNGLKIDTYEFRLDELILGTQASGADNRIVLNNITVRIIDSPKYEFIVGLNVLRYLTINYQPSETQSICQITFEDNGRRLLEKHRAKGINNMQRMFQYLQ